MDIKLKVTQESFDEVFSIDEWINFAELTNEEHYNKMLQFVVDKDGDPVSEVEARQMFRKIPKAEWTGYLMKFIEACREAFVNPTRGNGSGSQEKAESLPIPDGSQS